MASGPCGYQFRSAFSCFHHSESEPKGSDCYEEFQQMHECMIKYPALYGTDKDDDKEDEFAQLQQADDSDKRDTDSSSGNNKQPSS